MTFHKGQNFAKQNCIKNCGFRAGREICKIFGTDRKSRAKAICTLLCAACSPRVNFKNYILLFEFIKIIVVKIFNANQIGKIFQLADFFHLAIFTKWKNVANWKNSPSVFRVIFYWCEYKITENELFCY